MLELVDKDTRGASRIGEATIVERIFSAVIEQRLPPGTKLSEAALCDAFGVGRMRIRRALLLLASREIVDLHSNRGAFIASPTAEEARDVFEARQSFEPSVVRIAVRRAGKQDIASLRAHLEREQVAHRDRNRRDAIRLSGEFHVELATIAGNSVMRRTVKELVTRTSLIIGMFGSPGAANCPDEEHARILSAIERKDEEAAVKLMRSHLAHIEQQLDLTAEQRGNVDLVSILQPQP